MGWMTVLLAVGATARITRLIGRDSITFFFRDWLAAHSEDARDARDPDKPGEVSLKERAFTFTEDLVACPWCLSVWVSAPVAAAAWMWGDTAWFLAPALALSASYASGVTSTKED